MSEEKQEEPIQALRLEEKIKELVNEHNLNDSFLTGKIIAGLKIEVTLASIGLISDSESIIINKKYQG